MAFSTTMVSSNSTSPPTSTVAAATTTSRPLPLSPGLSQSPLPSQRQLQHLDHQNLASHQFSPPGPPPPTIVLHTSSLASSTSSSSFPSFSSSFTSSSQSPPRTTLSPRPYSVRSQPSPTLPYSPPSTFPSSPPLSHSPRQLPAPVPRPGTTTPTAHIKTDGFFSVDYTSEPPSNYYTGSTQDPTVNNDNSHSKPLRNSRGTSSPSLHQQLHRSPSPLLPPLHSLQGLGLVLEDPSQYNKVTASPKHDYQQQRPLPQRLSLNQLPRAHIDPQTSLPSPPSSGSIRYPPSPAHTAASTALSTVASAATSSSSVNEPSSPHSPLAKKANLNPSIQTPLLAKDSQVASNNNSGFPSSPSSSGPYLSQTTTPAGAASFADQYAHHLQQQRPSYLNHNHSNSNSNIMAAHPPPPVSAPHYPLRQESQHYRAHTHFPTPVNTSYYQQNLHNATTPSTPQQQQQPSAQHGNISREDYEEIEDRRRMQQQILRDKLLYAETHAPDPAMTVKTTTNHGFALGAFDMSESLAIVEDLLDYFGENEGALMENLDEADQFNQAELMEAERVHLQRESLIRHLYDSEEDYIRTLTDIARYYRQPMQLLVQQAEQRKGTLSFGSSSALKPVATKEEIQTLFGNLDELIRFHEGFRDALESRAKIWGPNQIISDLFMEVIPNFKVYTKYYTNFHGALTTLDRIMRLPHYKKFVEQCVADNPPGTPSLHLMLATPLRRISVTREIVCSICQATQTNHPDYRNLVGAYELFCQVSEQTRLDRLHAQDQMALFDIQSSMIAFPEPIMIPNRRLVLRADLHKVDSSLALEPRTYYLMNDVLLYARFDPKKNIYTFKGMFDLHHTQINNPEDNTTLPQLPNCLQIANAGRKQMIRCRSREEKNYWMETLTQAVEVVNNASDDPSAPLGDVLPLRKYATSIASDSTTSLATFAAQSSIKGGSGTQGAGVGSSGALYPPGGVASSMIGGTTNHSMKSKAISAFTNMTTASSVGMDTQSLASKASSTDSQGRPKPRRLNPQADFYGCSFGVSLDVNLNEDHMPANGTQRSLSSALQSGNNVSTTSVGTTSSSGSTTGSSILQAGMRTQQPLGAMLAAIPEDKLTPKQRKAKEALAKAVEARRQARLKEEAKRGKAAAPASSSASVHSNGSGGGGRQDATNKQVNADWSSSFIPVKVRRDVVGK